MADEHERKSGDQVGDVSRRRFIELVAASTAAGVGLRAGAAAEGPTGTLAAEQARLLRRILNRLIPADGKRPGAGDLGGERFIDRAMSASHDLRRHVVGILEAVRREVATSESPDGGSEMDAVLLRAQRDRPESFGVLLDAAYTSYYSDPRVLSALGWVDPSEATSLPPFDVSLLDSCRNGRGGSTAS